MALFVGVVCEGGKLSVMAGIAPCVQAAVCIVAPVVVGRRTPE